MRRAPDWLARRARLSGRAPALVDARTGSATTYAEWNRRANQTARWLESMGLQRGEGVAVLAANSELYLDVWFACGKLGAVLQPLNGRLPASVLEDLLGRTSPRVLLFDEGHQEKIPTLPAAKTSLAEMARQRSDLDDGDRAPRAELGDPWVYCATGGTTGRPKLAVLTHENVVWNAMGTAASWGLGPRHRALLNAPLFHTGGLNVFTAPLVWAGGASWVAPRFDADQVLELVDRGAITHFFGVPTMFLALQALPRFDRVDWSGVELVISGGAPCPDPVFQRFWSRGVPFKTGYGLTEAGPNNFWLPEEELREKPGDVGYPLMHVETRIVVEDEEVFESGVAGELELRGPHVISEYFADPEATRAALRPEGWLRTGDLAVRDSEGSHRIVGRKKDMYISGGENVYPAEVESVLYGYPGVTAAAVVGIPDPRWGEVGRAFVVLRAGETIEALQTWLVPRLADYQRPRSFVSVAALPTTGAGKVDKARLLREDPTIFAIRP